MENASKALLMAAGVLIAIMVISFGVLLLRKAGRMSAEYDTQMSENELAKFNGQFEVYDKDNNNIFDIITVCNLAWDVNKKNNFDEQNEIEVTIWLNDAKTKSYVIDRTCEKNKFSNGTYFYDATDNQMANGKILVNAYEDNGGQVKYNYLFKCTGITYSDITGKVKSITFQIIQNN